MVKVVSLFSGCGGSDAGIVAAGFDVVMANDLLPYARNVYLANHPATEYVLGGVRDFSPLSGGVSSDSRSTAG